MLPPMMPESEARHPLPAEIAFKKKKLETFGSLPLSDPRLHSSPTIMSSNISCDSATPVRSTDGNPKVDTKPDSSVGLFGEGGYLWENIDISKAVWPLATWCFLTGYMSVFTLHSDRKNR